MLQCLLSNYFEINSAKSERYICCITLTSLMLSLLMIFKICWYCSFIKETEFVSESSVEDSLVVMLAENRELEFFYLGLKLKGYPFSL